jgi:hypothetical protein
MSIRFRPWFLHRTGVFRSNREHLGIQTVSCTSGHGQIINRLSGRCHKRKIPKSAKPLEYVSKSPQKRSRYHVNASHDNGHRVLPRPSHHRNRSRLKFWPDGSPTEPILGQLGAGPGVGGRDRPPGGRSEVGDRNKGAFWAALKN